MDRVKKFRTIDSNVWKIKKPFYCLGINNLGFTGERGVMARLAAESRAAGTRKAHDMVMKAYKMFCQANGFNILKMSKKSILRFICQAEKDRKSHGFISNVSFGSFINKCYIKQIWWGVDEQKLNNNKRGIFVLGRSRQFYAIKL